MAKRKANKSTKKQAKGKIVWKYVAITVAALVLCGAGYSLVQRFKKDETPTVKTLVAQDYDRFALNDTTGIADEEDQSAISTSNYYALDGLKISLEEDATIKYQVNYYDKDFAFLGVDTLEDDFSETNRSAAKEMGAVYVKIEIIPTEDEDGVISALEKSSYVKQLTVEVSGDSVDENDSEESNSVEESSESVEEGE